MDYRLSLVSVYFEMTEVNIAAHEPGQISVNLGLAEDAAKLREESQKE